MSITSTRDEFKTPTYKKASYMIEAILQTLTKSGKPTHRSDVIKEAARAVERMFNVSPEKADHLAGRCITFCTRKGYIQTVKRGWFGVMPAGVKALTGYMYGPMASAFRASVYESNGNRDKSKQKSKNLKRLSASVNSGKQSDIEIVYWDFKTLDSWLRGVNGNKESESVSRLKRQVKTHAKDMNTRQKELFVIRIRELVAQNNCARLRTFRHMMQVRFDEDRPNYNAVLKQIDGIAQDIKGQASPEPSEDIRHDIEEKLRDQIREELIQNMEQDLRAKLTQSVENQVKEAKLKWLGETN